MQVAFHHHHKKMLQKTSSKNNAALDKFMDKIIYVVGSIGVLIFVPQLVSVWTSPNIAGVSLFSWLGMFIASLFWIFYGHFHKAKPIFFINILAGSIQFLIIVGILLHK